MQIHHTPGFCRPIALIMPPYTSAIRGVGLPGHGTFATPLVTTAPRRVQINHLAVLCTAEPKVPDAVMTGFLSSTPARLTAICLHYSSTSSAKNTGTILADPLVVHIAVLVYVLRLADTGQTGADSACHLLFQGNPALDAVLCRISL